MEVLQLREPDLVGIPLSHHAAESLREAILQGKLQPGERLVETEIASQLSLSRGPVRDALRQLAQEGLVTLVPRRGSYVSRLDRSDVWEIATLRAILEGLAARLLAERKDEATVDQLESILAEMAAAGDENPVPFANLDLRFHETLCRASGHKRLLQSWSNLRTQIWMFIRETRIGRLRPSDSTVEFHRSILQGIRAGDAEQAERAARHHIEFSGQQLEAILGG